MRFIVLLSVIALTAGVKIKSKHNAITQQNTNLFKYSASDVYSLPEDIDDDSYKPPTIYNGDSKVAKVTKLENFNSGRGQFKVSLKTENGIEVNQAGKLKDDKTFVISGSYTYTGADGKRYRVRYTADELGYHPITELDIDIPEPKAPTATASKLNGLGAGVDKNNGFQFLKRPIGGGNGLGGQGGANGLGGSGGQGANNGGFGAGNGLGGNGGFGAGNGGFGTGNGLGGNGGHGSGNGGFGAGNGLGGHGAGNGGFGAGNGGLGGNGAGFGIHGSSAPLSSASNTVVHQKGQGYSFESGLDGSAGVNGGFDGPSGLGLGSASTQTTVLNGGNGDFGGSSTVTSFGHGHQGIGNGAHAGGNGAHGSTSFGTGAHGSHGPTSFETGAHAAGNGAHGSTSFGTGAHGAHGLASFGTGAHAAGNSAHGSTSFGTGAHGSTSFGAGAGHGSTSFGSVSKGPQTVLTFGSVSKVPQTASTFGSVSQGLVAPLGGSGISVSSGSFAGSAGHGGFSSGNIHGSTNGNKHAAATETVETYEENSGFNTDVFAQTEHHDGTGYKYVPPTNKYLPPAGSVAHHSEDTYLPPLKK